MLLSKEERTKFIAWLEFTAHTCEGMAKQLVNVSGPACNYLVNRENKKANACRVIADDLKSVEDMVI